jgi:hypothetical protein
MYLKLKSFAFIQKFDQIFKFLGFHFIEKYQIIILGFNYWNSKFKIKEYVIKVCTFWEYHKYWLLFPKF